MKSLHHIWHEDDGVLSFEWVLLVTILTIGIVGGISAARDGIIDELGDVAQSALALDQSYVVDFAPDIYIHTPPDGQGPSDSAFVDGEPSFDDSLRGDDVNGQGPELDAD